MAIERAIKDQQELLDTHRRVLAHLIDQEASMEVYTPPHIREGIREKREEIRRIKQWLREQGGRLKIFLIKLRKKREGNR